MVSAPWSLLLTVVVLDGKPHYLTRCRNEIWGGIPWSSFFATFAFFAAKHQSRLGLFSVERGNAFYTISTFYTDRICVGPRGGYFRTGSEMGAAVISVTLPFRVVGLWLGRGCWMGEEMVGGMVVW